MAVVVVPLVRDHGVEYLFAATILMGVFQGMAAVLRLNLLMQFVSRSVITGFVNALAILIFLAQLPHILLNGDGADSSQFWINLGFIAAGLIIIYGLPRVTKAIPSPLVAIVLLAVAAIVFDLRLPTVGDMGDLPSALPSFGLPDVPVSFETLRIVFPYAVTLALVGLHGGLFPGAEGRSRVLLAILAAYSGRGAGRQLVLALGSTWTLGTVGGYLSASGPIEWPVAAGDRVVIVEDVVTTGGSSLKAIEKVRAAGLQVEGVVAIIDRLGPADPHVIRHQGKYYLYPTTDSRGYDVFVSDDLVHWEDERLLPVMADRDATDRQLGQRRIQHTLVTKFTDQTVGYSENATVDPDILAQDDHTIIFFHFLLQGQVEGLNHRHLSHCSPPP